MGLFDALMNLTRPYDDEDDDFLEEEEELQPSPKPAKSRNPFAGFGFGAPIDEEEAEELPVQKPATAPARGRSGKVVNVATNAAGPMQLVLAKPERFEACSELADHLKNRRAVLMNLETTTKETARRIVDFLSGVAYALGGRVKKISANTFIIIPSGVDLMGDLMDELESTGIYF